jgi:hypothetical protein
MKPFEFKYGDTQYRYECGWIHRQNIFGHYAKCCPILIDLEYNLENFGADQLRIILCAILHGYGYGIADGKYEKIQEFKRMFDID